MLGIRPWPLSLLSVVSWSSRATAWSLWLWSEGTSEPAQGGSRPLARSLSKRAHLASSPRSPWGWSKPGKDQHRKVPAFCKSFHGAPRLLPWLWGWKEELSRSSSSYGIGWLLYGWLLLEQSGQSLPTCPIALSGNVPFWSTPGMDYHCQSDHSRNDTALDEPLVWSSTAGFLFQYTVNRILM